MSAQEIQELEKQFEMERQSFKSQIKVLGDVNDQHIERVKELESKVEERDVKIAYLSRIQGMYDELKKSNELLKSQYDDLMQTVKQPQIDEYLKNSSVVAEMRASQQKSEQQVQVILDKLGVGVVSVPPAGSVVSEPKTQIELQKPQEQPSENKEQVEEQPPAEEVPKKLEGLKKGDKNRTVEEDKRLQEQVVSQTEYDDLIDFEDLHRFKTDEKEFLQNDLVSMFNDENWLGQFNAINTLRVMNKFYPAVLGENLPAFQNFMQASIENLRSNISKNALMFCTEFFANQFLLQTDQFKQQQIQFMSHVLPSIFHRTSDDKSFISKQAKQAAQNCLSNYIEVEALEITVTHGCHNPLNNKKIIEQAHTEFLKNLVANADLNKKEHQFLADGQEKSQLLIQTLVKGFESAPRIKKGTVEIFKILDTKISECNDKSLPSVEDHLKICLKTDEKQEGENGEVILNPYDEAKVQAIMQIFAQPKKQTASEKMKGFRSFMKTKMNEKNEKKTSANPGETEAVVLVKEDTKE